MKMMKEILKHAREELGLTQLEFSKEIGCSVRTYEGWEQGRSMSRLTIKHINSILLKHHLYYKDLI
jgi:transcriptional regulator with XRE-family HTH domain